MLAGFLSTGLGHNLRSEVFRKFWLEDLLYIGLHVVNRDVLEAFQLVTFGEGHALRGFETLRLEYDESGTVRRIRAPSP